jgi:2-methylcitrate synthase
MDVMRTGVSVLGCVSAGEGRPQPSGRARHRRQADGLAGLDAAVLVPLATTAKRIDVETDDDSIGGHFLHLLHGNRPSASWVRAMHTSLILYAEHEFNASTFTCRVIAGTGSDMYSAITGAIGALRGPQARRRKRSGVRSQKRYDTPMKPRPTSARASSARKS